MTGTALENNVDEMISLINILNPIIANEVKKLAFMASAVQFRKKIAPVYYRRKREDVLTELPDKIESKEWCSLNYEEEAVYEEAVLNKRYQDARRVSWNIDNLDKSCKAQRLKEIIDEAEKEGRKVLVFSFFLDTIDKIHNFLGDRCLNPINGSLNPNRRQEIIDEFDNSPAGTVLLAQITSGETGLNIQSASVVVICEPQFKPSTENQAISRAYRMGQSRNVLVYRLLCENTIDEKLIDLLEEKQNVFDTFADKSVAGQESLEIDSKTFGNIIEQEIERINEKRGQSISDNNISSTEEMVDTHVYKKSNDLNFTKRNGKEYYDSIMKMSYDELVNFLLNKYGVAKYDYFTNELCNQRNKKSSRTSEGLFCHHIDENKVILLCNEKNAKNYPYDYQKAERLVYCNILEHLLLHILILENYKSDDYILGIGGAVFYIVPFLNDIYNNYEFKREWFEHIKMAVIDDYDSYIVSLRRLWKDIQSNKLLSNNMPKENLALGSDKRIFNRVLNDL